MPFADIVVLPILLISTPVAGAELRKCVGADGAVSYQSLPCAEGSRQAWVQPVKAVSVPAGPPRPKARANAARSSRSAPPASGRNKPARRPSAAQARRERCEKARSEADALRDRLWNKLVFQQRSELDAKVARACARRPG